MKGKAKGLRLERTRSKPFQGKALGSRQGEGARGTKGRGWLPCGHTAVPGAQLSSLGGAEQRAGKFIYDPLGILSHTNTIPILTYCS